MMKKIIATALCLTISAPCFAAGRYSSHYPYQAHNNAPYPHYEQRYDYHNDIHRHKDYYRTSQRTKTLAAVAGVAGLATLISVIAD